jgi:hypothetical protein
MRDQIHDRLRPVVRRQSRLTLLRGLAYGLLTGSALGVAIGVGKWLTGRPVPPLLAVAVLVLGPLVGCLLAALRRRGWHDAALAVDAHHRLKDRTVTALEFVTRPQSDALHHLQVADATEHLAAVEPRAIVPIRVPRTLPLGVGLLLIAIALLAWPLSSKPARAGLTPAPDHIVAQAEKIQEDLKELDELAKQQPDSELKDLVKELQKKAEEMKQPGVDTKEALAKLSEMQAAIAAQQAQFNLGLVDGQLQSLGDAMVPADALEAAGQALQEGKFEQAVKELEKLDAPPLDRKEAKAVEEKMKQVAKQMGEVGLGQMGESASELADGIKGGHKGQFQKGAKGLARLTKGHGQRKKILEILDKELEKLSECKGQCQSDKLVRARIKEKSNSPSERAGASISGNLDGEKTALGSKRNIKEITGQPGDGPSEMETTHSPEGRQSAARGYRETYQKYRKMSEAVLDSEPIPLGHRQTIRRYFELIRPQNASSEKGE